jgi:AraC-like DNA-binding protein
MSVKKRIQELMERLQDELQRQLEEQVRVWLRGLPDEDLVRLVGRQKALRESTGDPEHRLTLEDMADTLGKSQDTLEAEIRAAGGGKAPEPA